MASHEDSLSETYLLEIQQRLDRATTGPWKSYVEERDKISGSDFIMTAGGDIYLSGGTIDDQEFVAHARQDIPALMREIRRLRSALGRQ